MSPDYDRWVTGLTRGLTMQFGAILAASAALALTACAALYFLATRAATCIPQ